MGTTLHTPVGFTARAGAGVPLVVGLAVLGTAITASLFLGSQPLAPRQVLAYLFGDSASLPEATAAVLDLRVPRTILGLVCGAALGLAGALCQMHTRNPLADPGLLGVTSGAACGVVFALGVLRLSSPAQYTVFGLIGALLAGGLVLGLASGIKLTDAATSLVLAGAIVTGALNSVSSTVVLMDRVTMDRFRYWTVGSLSGRDTSVLWDVAPWLLLGLLLAIHNSSSLDALALGDDVAASLGRNVVRDRVTGLLAVVLLAGSATAAMGAIAFLGLAAPHLARRITRARLPVVAAVSALLGAALMLAADTVGRLVLASGELSVGIVLSVIGAPIFILLARSLKRGRGNATR